MKTKFFIWILMLSIAPSFAQNTKDYWVGEKIPALVNLQKHYLLYCYDEDFHYDWSKQDKQIYTILNDSNLWHYQDANRFALDSIIYKKKPQLRTQDTITYEELKDCVAGYVASYSEESPKISIKLLKHAERWWRKQDKITKEVLRWCDTIYQDFDSTYTRYMANPQPILQDPITNEVFIQNLKIAKPIIDSLHPVIMKWKSGRHSVWYYYCCINLLTQIMDKFVPERKIGKEEESYIMDENWSMIDETFKEWDCK